MGICPTCLNRQTNGGIYGDDSKLRVYEDEDIDCLFVANPRAKGHLAIISKTHYHDMSEAPDKLNEKIVSFAKQFMIAIKQIFGCERVYMCTMCDGANNHYHIQLIPRYKDEKRGSSNFVKPRMEYVFDPEKTDKLKEYINRYAKKRIKRASLLKMDQIKKERTY